MKIPWCCLSVLYLKEEENQHESDENFMIFVPERPSKNTDNEDAFAHMFPYFSESLKITPHEHSEAVYDDVIVLEIHPTIDELFPKHHWVNLRTIMTVLTPISMVL